MGLWGAIKIALNSTLGTDEFQPLDKLIRGLYRRIVASDTEQLVIRDTEVIYEAESSNESDPPIEKNIGKITINADGAIRISVRAKHRNLEAKIAVAMTDITGNKIYTPELVDVSTSYTTYNFDFNVSTGMGTVVLDLLIKTPYVETSAYLTYLSIDRVAVCYDEIAELPKAIL